MADRFQTTSWTLVLAAGSDGEGSREALEWLCRTYWYPLYAFVRRQGRDAEAARDLTQAFFVSLLERSAFQRIDPSLGKFRAFLLASVKHFLSNQRARETSLKRRGEHPAFAVDLEDAERRYRFEASPDLGPDELFESRWARSILDRALHRLKDEHDNAGKGETFRRLSRHLTGEEPPYERTAEDLALTPNAARVAVHRLRRRLGALLREEVAQTISDSEDVDQELRCLLEAAGRGA